MEVTLDKDERIDALNGGLKIIQSSSAPCFAIDAVLLADFVSVSDAQSIVDLGTGTGILPLLLSRKFPNTKIFGVELMPQMLQMAQKSVQLNSLAQQLQMIKGDIRAIADSLPKAEADIVISNPPYYKLGHGRKNEELLFAAARQEQFCSLDELLSAAALVLKPLGKFYLIYRVERFNELMAQLIAHKLNPERIRFVQPQAEQEANLVLVEAKKNGRGKTHVLPALIVYGEDGAYTKEMQKIYAR